MGLASMQDVADAVAVIRERIDIPMIVDMDTGFGNAMNVQRSVRVLERSGASALQMEDQVMPKRCGHMSGKEVISCEEMVGKIKAALDALERAERYLEAGADVLFIEAPHNLVEGGNSPVAAADELEAMGYRVALYPVALLHQFIPGARDLLRHILENGRTDTAPMKLIDLAETNGLLGADALLECGARYSGD